MYFYIFLLLLFSRDAAGAGKKTLLTANCEIQNDLDTILHWPEKLQLALHSDQCIFMHFGLVNHTTLRGKYLQIVHEESDLSIIRRNNLKRN